MEHISQCNSSSRWFDVVRGIVANQLFRFLLMTTLSTEYLGRFNETGELDGPRIPTPTHTRFSGVFSRFARLTLHEIEQTEHDTCISRLGAHCRWSYLFKLRECRQEKDLKETPIHQRKANSTNAATYHVFIIFTGVICTHSHSTTSCRTVWLCHIGMF